MICECGCNAEVGPDRKGRPRRFVLGHSLARWRAENPGAQRKRFEDYPEPVRDEETGCLLWQGPTSNNGYARMGRRYVHIEVYTAAVGVIPKGWQVDHVHERGCRHRHCIAVEHLEAIPQTENIRRQPNVIAQVNKTHCLRDHPFDEENTRWRNTKNGGRKRACRACDRARAKKMSM